MDILRKASSKVAIFEKIESTYKIKKEYILLGFIVLSVIIIMSTPLGPLITSTVGIILPLQQTLAVLKQVNPNKDEMKHLLVFWLVFGLLTTLDAYSKFLIGFIPLFYTFKFALLLYIGPYKFRGGQYIYDNVLSHIPEEWYLSENGIDKAVKAASKVVKDTTKDIKNASVIKDKKNE